MRKCKHILISFIACLIPFLAYDQEPLNRYIKLPPQELSVEQYLDYVHKTTGYDLAFSYAIVENRKLALLADSLPLKSLLDTLFTNRKVKYFLRDN